MLRAAIRTAAGGCPSCNNFPTLGVIYRRSIQSITFRCNACSLKWTITLANLHHVAKRKAQEFKDDAHIAIIFETVQHITAFAAESEAARTNTIRRQTKRRVIRLPEKAA